MNLHKPGLFIKNADGNDKQFIIMKLEYFTGSTFFFRLCFAIFILYRHFLPRGRADLSPFTSLRQVRGGSPQLHPPTPCNWANLDS